MHILVIGSGAREHALALGLSKDPAVTEIHVAPGNVGMESIATVHAEATQVDDPDAMLKIAQETHADLVVVGPEIPLVAGVADTLRSHGFAVFGPNKDAAQIEGSKAFAKDVMAKAGVKTARAEQIVPGASDAEREAALDNFGPHYVVKDDGLAGGKGVVVTKDRAQARAHVDAVLAAGNPVLLESFLDGPEVSLFCLVDGETVVPLLPAQDHKRAHDNDEGPNTGGMGAYTPLPWLPEDGVQRIVDEVCVPVAREMVARGCAYSGLLYAGIAWGEDGPAVVEFNCRFGDPETQAVLALLKTPLAGALHAVATEKLAELPPLEWEDGYALTVVLAAEGYPQNPRKGGEIVGAEDPAVLHAGTARDADGKLVAAGGRVLNVIGTGASLIEARDKAYSVLNNITLAGSHYRSDIALPAVEGKITI
ncbi:phosphoribosylamine--glycine ligase [Corynebacterium pseudotuberculosis]|uniref:Phosphoribosylamine--glycine ligase n=1 Tax=Corynebacterium pseudotuberculosis (strain C231) TaxID=681645 RepID=D9QCB4_CORP2|nr:phosphoribosylamine--glycine ligase [Corynebacterium pseudotuberculosis]ADL11190.1 phosphoribosylamine--glycine ligase [Corynebacterium pseudotuberculosis C231]ADO26999.1 phosphoribosylamine--glycine ligase [Corynebacterium pseudotuberculosis I19]AEK93063.1 Phosphoribosylamine--glycine ligase [Corynebacterium pseudotuberculosis PAT10]AFF22889.1 Phosphoribosylamine--glycine ligase [Corynebacterium pseudotuberculosis P54B96]AFH52687.1 Phosphoribosylamine--glycine ligase [Corynebacterium pseud